METRFTKHTFALMKRTITLKRCVCMCNDQGSDIRGGIIPVMGWNTFQQFSHIFYMFDDMLCWTESYKVFANKYRTVQLKCDIESVTDRSSHKARMRTERKFSLFFNPGTTWRRVVRFRSRSLKNWNKNNQECLLLQCYGVWLLQERCFGC